MSDGVERHVEVIGTLTAEDERGGAFTLYRVQVRLDHSVWTVERRFSQIKRLSEQLKMRANGAELPQLPAGLLHAPWMGGGNMNYAFIAKRAHGMQAYLRDLLGALPPDDPLLTSFISSGAVGVRDLSRSLSKCEPEKRLEPAYFVPPDEMLWSLLWEEALPCSHGPRVDTDAPYLVFSTAGEEGASESETDASPEANPESIGGEMGTPRTPRALELSSERRDAIARCLLHRRHTSCTQDAIALISALLRWRATVESAAVLSGESGERVCWAAAQREEVGGESVCGAALAKGGSSWSPGQCLVRREGESGGEITAAVEQSAAPGIRGGGAAERGRSRAHLQV